MPQVDVFFYGLFMDEALLRSKGTDPTTLGRARVENYEIRIGERASLIPFDGATSYGVVVRLTRHEVEELYAEDSVADYVPEDVRAISLDGGQSMDAICYNLPADSIGTSVNVKYASELGRLARKMGFPTAYIQVMESQSAETSWLLE